MLPAWHHSPTKALQPLRQALQLPQEWEDPVTEVQRLAHHATVGAGRTHTYLLHPWFYVVRTLPYLFLPTAIEVIILKISSSEP